MISVRDVDIKNKKVLLKIDGDTPMINNRVADDYRLQVSLPTIEYILKKGAAEIIILSHLGRPKGKVAPELKMAPAAERLAELLKMAFRPAAGGYEIGAKIKFLENIRFDKREEENNQSLAEEWARQADIFVQDGLADCHRLYASVVAITKLLPSFAGCRLEQEIEELDCLLNPPRPFVAIIGGDKLDDKLPLAQKIARQADRVLLGGMVANAFQDDDGKFVLPIDDVEERGNIRDIGDKTIEKFSEIIAAAKTIFWAGCLGVVEDEKFQTGSRQIALAIGQSQAATRVAAGGDTVGFLRQHHLDNNFTFLSAGGAATLEYLTEGKLAGVEALRK
ncbi:MAG: phosphoglycerate kinase [Candidatus Berkelbacteria bacterium Licking1014_2]|uniref:Phosphoglycerate kinase n=1 Tax=Candidatus Berkelbacteria bacterium Licking1014_2 TaxID=2017146 RepID=A0A554LXA1_9BACT|nr:MAG: phosphoglycerate kinase [Candidatus Berkelbacteria bacterium Licking1014_2]